MTTTHFSNLKRLIGDARFTGSVSPAEALDLVTAYDDSEDAWPIYTYFAVGDRIVSPSGRMYNIIGFTRADTMITTQAGLDQDPAILFVELKAFGMKHADDPVLVSRHRDGLVTFL